MALARQRDLAELSDGIAAWLVAQRPTDQCRVVDVHRPAVGWSCETLIVTLEAGTGTERVVLRLPPVADAIFPAYDLELQAAAQELAGAHGVPTATPVRYEADPSWLGTSFLAMPFVEGHVPAELVAKDRWITALAHKRQAALWSSMLGTLAAIHRTPWDAAPLRGRLRGARGGLAEELAWWHDYLEWVADGSAVLTLRDALAWCAANTPTREPEPSLLWGDVRLGNLIFDGETLRPRAVLDWDMVSVGPAEMDLAWLLALEFLPQEFGMSRVGGFPDHDASVREFQQHLGRPVRDLAWYEIFAMVRSTAVLARIGILFRTQGEQARSAIDVEPAARGPRASHRRVRASRLSTRGPSHLGAGGLVRPRPTRMLFQGPRRKLWTGRRRACGAATRTRWTGNQGGQDQRLGAVGGAPRPRRTRRFGDR